MNIKKVAVLGTGTMGHGIAQLCAQAGMEVKMFGRSDASLQRGYNSIRSNLTQLINSGKITSQQAEEIISRIHGVKTIAEAVEGVDLVSESVAEELELKQRIFEEMDEICPPNVILTTNTSGLSPTAIAANTRYPERIVVAHFWNPPQLIPLVEVVPGVKTSQETVENTVNWVKLLGKQPVKLNRECLGFVGNRLQLALLREALYIVEQGWAEPEEVDKAVEYGFGRRLPVTGPLKSADLGGLDIFYNISTYLFADLCNSTEPSSLLKQKVEKGHLGCKTGEGIYKWSEEEIQKIKERRNNLLLYFIEEDEKNRQ